jgi:hypothetical protein
MNRLCWTLADLVSAALDPAEREVLRGDLAESGETGFQALRDALGLVIRRPWTIWKSSPQWLLLLLMVLPLASLLSWTARRMADGSAIYIWLYVNNWDWSFWSNHGVRHDLVHFAGIVAFEYFALFWSSWGSGFLLGSVSGRSLPLQSLLFALFVILALFLGPYCDRALFLRARDFPINAAVFDVVFYRLVFPPIVQLMLVLGPSFWGMAQAQRVRGIPRGEKT